MQETQKTIADWADATFGPATPGALIERARTELDEMLDAVRASDPPAHVVEEAADVLILLLRAAELCGGDLLAAVDAKMAENRRRSWTRAGDGTGRHIG